MDETHIEINGTLISKEEIEREFPSFLQEVLFDEELAALKLLEDKMGFNIGRFVAENADLLPKMFDGENIVPVALPMHRIISVLNKFKLPENAEDNEELESKVGGALPGIVMAFYFYAQSEGSQASASALAQVFKKFIEDFSQRTLSEPPPFVLEISKRIEKIESSVSKQSLNDKNIEIDGFISKINEKFGSIQSFIEQTFTQRNQVVQTIQIIFNNGTGNTISTGNDSTTNSNSHVNLDEDIVKLLAQNEFSVEHINALIQKLNLGNQNP